jgi:hypothetical protein
MPDRPDQGCAPERTPEGTQTVTPARSPQAPAACSTPFNRAADPLCDFLPMSSRSVHVALLSSQTSPPSSSAALPLEPPPSLCTLSYKLRNEAPRRPLRRLQPSSAGPTSTHTPRNCRCQLRNTVTTATTALLWGAPCPTTHYHRRQCACDLGSLGAGAERDMRRGPVAGEESVWGARVALEGGGIAC